MKGGLCGTHGEKIEQKLCRQRGCANIVGKSGLCVQHSGKIKRNVCGAKGFSNQFVRQLITILLAGITEERLPVRTEDATNKYGGLGGVCYANCKTDH